MIRKVSARPAQSYDPSSGAASDEQRYVNAAEVRQRYQRSDMTIWRWIRDPRVEFPPPVKLGAGGLNSWWLPTLLEWEARRAEQTVTRIAGGRHYQAAALP